MTEALRNERATDKTAFDFDNIVRVYSGKPGCACGCNGKYYDKTERPDMVRRIVRRLKELQLDEENYPGIWSAETETRLYIAYDAVGAK